MPVSGEPILFRLLVSQYVRTFENFGKLSVM